MRRSVFASAMTLIVGLLVGAACSNEIAAVADAAVDAVGRDDLPVPLDATLCESLDEVLAELQAHEERIGSLEGKLAAAEADLGSLTTNLTNTKIYQGQLAELIESKQTQIEALQAQLDDDSCPDGMATAGDYCIEFGEREAHFIGNIQKACAEDGLHLCSFEEIYAGCLAGVGPPDEPIWTATPLPEGYLITDMGFPSHCNPTLAQVSPYEGVHRPFRCCKGR